jgi:hypothetical protein
MISPSDQTRSAETAGVLVAVALIAYQVIGKATRDALFLSTFGIRGLPWMVITSAVVSLIVVLASSRTLQRLGPARLMPVVLVASAVLLLIEWGLTFADQRAAAVVVYLHFAALGALLLSGFWSMVNERFDPRTAKSSFTRIIRYGTLGGLIGGLLTAKLAGGIPVSAMLPILAGLHLFSAIAIRGLSPPPGAEPAPKAVPYTGPDRRGPHRGRLFGLEIIAGVPYLRTLVTLVLLVTVSEGLLDFVFKARASAQYGGGEALLRLFALYYGATALLTFVVQTGFAHRALQRFRVFGTVASLPIGVAAGSAVALMIPALWSAIGARGVEAVLHNSLYRSAYELLYTPIRPVQKRATKLIIDVAMVRLGDGVAGALVWTSLLLGPILAIGVLLGVALALAVIGCVVTMSLEQGYAETLEQNLLSRGLQLAPQEAEDTITRTTIFDTLGMLNLRGQLADVIPAEAPSPAAAEPMGPVMPRPAVLQPELQRILELRSGDAGRVVHALVEPGPLTRSLVSHVIPLLAWDQVSAEAIKALQRIAGQAAGTLLDALLDPEEDFTIRRRIPAVLAASPTDRVASGLIRGLEDRRFEVRYRCGRALGRLQEQKPDLAMDRERIIDAVLREVNVDRSVWESQRLLDQPAEDDASTSVERFLRERAGRSLQHVFSMLSLILPPEPLMTAFRLLLTTEQLHRGTALEYLEIVLPDRVREKLWPFLEDERRDRRTGRTREEVLADLMRSNDSIAINVAELRRRDAERT